MLLYQYGLLKRGKRQHNHNAVWRAFVSSSSASLSNLSSVSHTPETRIHGRVGCSMAPHWQLDFRLGRGGGERG